MFGPPTLKQISKLQLISQTLDAIRNADITARDLLDSELLRRWHYIKRS